MKPTYVSKIFGVFIFIINATFPSIAFSENTEQENIEALLRQAEFVFEGTVVNVEYRFSKAQDESLPPTPYTFVSYNILNIIKGTYPQRIVTLRFYGGPIDGDEFVTTEDQPYFDVGDHDLLLVKGNNYLLCPLVNCAGGRFRYIGGLVVNEYGQTIRLNKDGTIMFGQAIDNEDINKHKMGKSIQLERHNVHEQGEDYLDAVPIDKVDRTFLPDTAGYTSLIQQKVIENHSPEELAALPPFETSDPNQEFVDEFLNNAHRKPVKGSAETIESDTMPEDEKIERMIVDLLETSKSSMSVDERQALIVELAKQYPEFYYDGVSGTEIVKQAATIKSDTGTGVIEEGQQEIQLNSLMSILALDSEPGTLMPDKSVVWFILAAVLALLAFAFFRRVHRRALDYRVAHEK